jgi:hypothetical protein
VAAGQLEDSDSGEAQARQGGGGGNVIDGVGHIYVVHFEPLADRREYLESVFFDRWGLAQDYVTFITWCDSRTTPRAKIEEYYQVPAAAPCRLLRVA